MADEKTEKKVDTWALIVDPKKPGKSLVLYKGEPVADVMQASVSVEPLPLGDGKVAVLPVFTLKLTTSALTLGTYDAPSDPVQTELPLADKKLPAAAPLS